MWHRVTGMSPHMGIGQGTLVRRGLARVVPSFSGGIWPTKNTRMNIILPRKQ